MKNYFFTLDLEEWSHLEYLKEHRQKINSGQSFIKGVIPFLQGISEKGINMTVFVVGDIAEQNKDIIREIANQGHEIACHSYTHNLIYKLSDEQFREETKRAKSELEDIICKPVLGYRAPCFSMDKSKLDILWECGFKYDASLIRFKEHKLYNVLDVSDFNKIDSLVYEKDGRFVFETPTLKVAGHSIPISGGGYFRLFPPSLMKYLMKKYMKQEDNFVFYVHPFELSDILLEGIDRAGFKNKFRFQVGRKNNLKKLKDYIDYISKLGFEFVSFGDYLKRMSINEKK